MSDSEDVRKQLEALRSSYAKKLSDKLRDLEEKWNLLSQSDWEKNLYEPFYQAVHSLAGSGATFGFDLVSETASTIERLILTISARKKPPGDEEKARLEELVRELRLNALNPDKPIDLVSVKKPLKQPKTSAGPSTKDIVFLVEDDKEVAADLAVQIGYYGYDIKTFNSLENIEKAMDQNPVAVIMDIVFPEGKFAGTRIMEKIQESREEPLPVIFISASGDLRSRLGAVRAGGRAYFTKPLDVDGLVAKLDALTEKTADEPYRILIVEDEVDLARTYALILKQFGMITRVVNDPIEVFDHLTEYRPELILMDLYMPKCSGLELAAVIRQEEDYVGIPIVFLSTETNVDRQLSAIKLGGDEFLVKPIKADHLISSIVPRVKRSRILQSFMMRDSMTKLYNHTAIKQKLDVELSRAVRAKAEMSFAMLDIDHFKAVNDTYGHSTGDRIIKSLSNLLQQRLRITDVIGRYGGEEFAVVLPDTNRQDAFNVMDEIRKSFAAIRHRSEEKDFYVTFSCGISGYPGLDEAEAISEAADQALYTAKHGGRNQIAIADS